MKSLDPQSPAARHLAEGRYVLRHLDAAGLAACPIPWMQAAGWNPGLRDAETFITADPLGFLVGELEGQPIATVSGVRYDDTFGFIGCYIVAEPFRGQGYGLAIHEAARRHLAGCTQGGDGVLENVQKYQRIGRVFAHRNARYEFMRPASLPSPARALTDARAVPLDEILTLDRACFPAPRRSFLQAWIHQAGATALAVRDESGFAGYGVIRPCFRGWKIGPLFAKDPTTAEDLFRGLLQHVPVGDPCVLDIPEPNEDARQLVARHAMKEVFATARMYTGPFPKIQTGWVYGITTFELG
jgi:hypothetical protein